MAIGIGEHDTRKYLQRLPNNGVVIACINSPSSVTLSGNVAGLDQVKALLDADSIFARRLKVETAYHSSQMAVVSDAYLRAIQDVKTIEGDSRVQMFSSVTGRLIETKDLGPHYWIENMVSTVKFSEAVGNLLDYSAAKRKRIQNDKSFVDITIELGPHAALEGPLKQIFTARKSNVHYLSLLRRGEMATNMALEAVGRLHTHGYAVDILQVNSQNAAVDTPAVLVGLPSYPWNKTYRYWFESQLSVNYRFRKYPRHDLLGTPTPDSQPHARRWRNFLRVSEVPWIEHHVVCYPLLAHMLC